MKLTRKVEINITNGNELGNFAFQIGDQINVGKFYTATCQKVGKKGAIFLFDQCLNHKYSMNHMENDVSEYGYKESILRCYLKQFSMNAMFDAIRDMMIPFKNGDLLRIPMVEEIFTPEKFYHYYGEKYKTPSNKKQWPLMKNRLNRIAICGEEQTMACQWLENKYGEYNHFAVITPLGNLANNPFDRFNGVRVVFKLNIEQSLLKKIRKEMNIMSMTKRYVENLAYKYLESHPEMNIEEVMNKISEGEITDEENAE